MEEQEEEQQRVCLMAENIQQTEMSDYHSHISDVVVGSEECSISRVVLILMDSKSFHRFEEKFVDVAMRLDTGLELRHKLKRKLNEERIGLAEAVHSLLEEWVSRMESRTTVFELVQILRSAGLGECAETLRSEFEGKTAVYSYNRMSALNTVRPIERYILAISVAIAVLSTILWLVTLGLYIRNREIQQNSILSFTQLPTWLAEVCLQKGNYSSEMARMIGIRVDVNTSQVPLLDPEDGVKLKKHLENYYLELLEYFTNPFNSNFEVVDVIVRADEYNTISFPKNRIEDSVISLKKNPPDYKAFETYLIQLVQQCQSMPSWLRYALNQVTKDRDRSYTFDNSSDRSYFANYTESWNAAIILNWVDQNYQPMGKNVTRWLHQICLDGTYTNDTFVSITGKTMEQLVWEFLNNKPHHNFTDQI